MRNYSDKDLNRILDEADELLANIQLYETPEEEAARKEREQQEEQERLEALRRQQEAEQRRLEEEVRRQEEERRKREEERQKEAQLLQEELQKQQEASEQLEQREADEETQSEQVLSDGYAEWPERQEEAVSEEVAFGEDSGASEEDRWSAFLAERQEEDDYQARRKAEKAEQKRKKKEEVQKQKREKQKKQKKQEKQENPEEKAPVGTLWFCGIFAAVCYVWMEVLTHIAVYQSVDSTILYPILFAAGAGCVLTVVCSFFGKRVNSICYLVVTILMGAYCDLQVLYHGVTSSFLRITQLRESLWVLKLNQAMTLQELKQVFPWLLIMFVPLLLWALVGRHWIRFEKGSWFQRLVLLFAGIILAAVAVLTLDIHGYEVGSPYVTFYHYDSMTMLEPAGKQLGVLVTTVLDMLH